MAIRKHVGATVPVPIFHSLCDELAAYETALAGCPGGHDLHEVSLSELSAPFASLCRSGEIDLIVREQLVSIRDSTALPPMANNTLLLAETEAHLLSLTLFRARPQGDSKLLRTDHLLLTQSSHSLFAQLSRGPLALPRYGLVHARDASAPAVVRVRDATLDPRELIFIDAKYEFLDFIAPRDYLLLRLTSKGFLPFVWVVDRGTLKVVMTTSSVPSISRLPLALKLSARLLADEGVDTSSPHYAGTLDIVRRYADHDYHFVRWAAIQTLCYVDIEAGRPFLVRSLHDRHPHIRRAAQRALELFPAP